MKNIFYKVKEFFNKLLDGATLMAENKYLRKELDESKAKEKPYIDKIQLLKSDLRVMKILNTKLENKAKKLESENIELKKKQNKLFEE